MPEPQVEVQGNAPTLPKRFEQGITVSEAEDRARQRIDLLITRRSHGIPLSVEPPAGVGSLYVAFLFLSGCAALPDPFWLITFFSVVPLVHVQRYATAVALHHSPGADANTRIRGSNWWAVVFGGLLVVLAAIGAFLPETPPT